MRIADDLLVFYDNVNYFYFSRVTIPSNCRFRSESSTVQPYYMGQKLYFPLRALMNIFHCLKTFSNRKEKVQKKY